VQLASLALLLFFLLLLTECLFVLGLLGALSNHPCCIFIIILVI
jgi:hypothetical protein